jgi:hypothetical protein
LKGIGLFPAHMSSCTTANSSFHIEFILCYLWPPKGFRLLHLLQLSWPARCDLQHLTFPGACSEQ